MRWPKPTSTDRTQNPYQEYDPASMRNIYIHLIRYSLSPEKVESLGLSAAATAATG
jgi:hypothetical protein